MSTQKTSPETHSSSPDNPASPAPKALAPADPGRPPGRGSSVIAPVAIAAVVAFAVGYCAGDRGPASSGDSAGHDHGGSAESAVWTCPMHPQIRAPEPGQCPICGMELVELAAPAPGQDDEQPDDARITLTERARLLAEIRTVALEPMTPMALAASGQEVRLLGKIDYDETRIKSVTAWTGGRIERLLVAATGQRVTPGQPIARLYSPEIYSAHSDLIQARKQVERLQGASELTRRAAESARDAARQRLQLLGIPDPELVRLEAAEKPARQITIRAQAAGTVIARSVDEGNYVAPGTTLYRVADLSRVWVQLEAYERDLIHIAVGDRVTLTVSGVVGEPFEGKVAFVDPTVDPRTRIARVRVEVGNRRGVLRPGMFAEAVVHSAGPTTGSSGSSSGGESGEGPAGRPAQLLVVPESAPLFTGKRSIVYVEHQGQDGHEYEAREVTLGPRLGDPRFGSGYPVVAGLEAGERVVIRGAFVIDADLQIQGGASMMARDQESPRSIAPGDLPDPMATSLTEVIEGYLAAQRALAGDDIAAARSAGQAITTAVGATGERVPERLRRSWDPLAVALATHGRNLGRAQDLDHARQSFDGLSGAMIDLLARLGNPGDQTIHLAYCPMAFDGRGASWLQLGTTIANAYHGADMPTCGSIHGAAAPGMHLETEPGSGSGKPAPASGPTGHQHGGTP